MTRSDFLLCPRQRLIDTVPKNVGAQASGKRPATGISFDAFVRLGRELTRRIAVVESNGDFQKVDRLLRRKDRLHRLRRELSDASF